MGNRDELAKDLLNILLNGGSQRTLAYLKNDDFYVIGAPSLRSGQHLLKIYSSQVGGTDYGELKKRFGHLVKSYDSFDDLEKTVEQDEDIILIGDDFIGFFLAAETNIGWRDVGYVRHPEFNINDYSDGDLIIKCIDTQYEEKSLKNILKELNNNGKA